MTHEMRANSGHRVGAAGEHRRRRETARAIACLCLAQAALTGGGALHTPAAAGAPTSVVPEEAGLGASLVVPIGAIATRRTRRRQPMAPPHASTSAAVVRSTATGVAPELRATPPRPRAPPPPPRC